MPDSKTWLLKLDTFMRLHKAVTAYAWFDGLTVTEINLLTSEQEEFFYLPDGLNEKATALFNELCSEKVAHQSALGMKDLHATLSYHGVGPLTCTLYFTRELEQGQNQESIPIPLPDYWK